MSDRPKNEGARLLRLVKEQRCLTDDEMEATIGGGSMSRYMSGERIPDLRWAIGIEDAFDVPVRAWFQKAMTPRGHKPARTDGQTTRQGDSR